MKQPIALLAGLTLTLYAGAGAAATSDQIAEKMQRFVVLSPGMTSNAEVTYRVRLRPSGELEEVSLVTSSGVPTYDAAVERAIRAANPLPVPSDPVAFARVRDANYRFRPFSVSVYQTDEQLGGAEKVGKDKEIEARRENEARAAERARIEAAMPKTVTACKQIWMEDFDEPYHTAKINRCVEIEATAEANSPRGKKLARCNAMKSVPYPALGSTVKQVQASCWGAWEHTVNRTITSRGTREQWVYGQKQYLYFDNGVLTAIQD